MFRKVIHKITLAQFFLRHRVVYNQQKITNDSTWCAWKTTQDEFQCPFIGINVMSLHTQNNQYSYTHVYYTVSQKKLGQCFAELFTK